jgi:predicted sulfurtransferase
MMYLSVHPVWSQIQDIEAKASIVEGHMFDKMIVKYRAEIVALGQTITQAAFARSCQEIDDLEFKTILDTQDPERVILDMRNSYEHKLGHFT